MNQNEEVNDLVNKEAGSMIREELNYTVIDKKTLKKCRHKAERRWFRRLAILNILIIIVIGAMFHSELNDTKEYFKEFKNIFVTYANAEGQEEEEASKKLDEILEDFPDSVSTAFGVVLLLLALPLILYYTYAGFRSMSVQITERNFPEIFRIAEEYAARLGMKEVPSIYIIQGNGVLNAFASCVPFKQYIELYADLVEVAYREHHDMDTIRFVIGHEMAHIYLRHATLHYSYAILFSNLLPVLPAIASRTREYSCDRIAQLLSGSDGIDAIMSLTTGIHLYKQVNQEDYIDHARDVKGFFVWCFNLVSSHPVTSKRILALKNKDVSGDLY